MIKAHTVSLMFGRHSFLWPTTLNPSVSYWEPYHAWLFHVYELLTEILTFDRYQFLHLESLKDVFATLNPFFSCWEPHHAWSLHVYEILTKTLTFDRYQFLFHSQGCHCISDVWKKLLQLWIPFSVVENPTMLGYYTCMNSWQKHWPLIDTSSWYQFLFHCQGCHCILGVWKKLLQLWIPFFSCWEPHHAWLLHLYELWSELLENIWRITVPVPRTLLVHSVHLWKHFRCCGYGRLLQLWELQKGKQ